MAFLSPSSGSSHLEAATPLVRVLSGEQREGDSRGTYTAMDSNYRGVAPCEKGWYPTSGVAASKCELPDDGGEHATETCRSKDGPVRTLGSHRVKTCVLLLVLFGE
jgi:hypothetical protein